MAKQSDIINLIGISGDITFRKTGNGYRAVRKRKVNKQRIASDPRFDLTRKNGQEFGRAGKAGKVLRHAFAPAVGSGSGCPTGRLVSVMMKCLKSDPISHLGERDVVNGDLRLIEGFNFNKETDISSSFLASYATTVDRATGTVSISIPSFVPATLVRPPEGATYFRFIMAAAEVDFASEDNNTGTAASSYQPIGNTALPGSTLTVSLTANTALPIFVVLGIRFYREVNGTQYNINGGAKDAITIVKVDV